MINFSILLSSSEVSGPGGLFDIDATLPLVAVQFILLMFILNTILYSPLSNLMQERDDYINRNKAETLKLQEENTTLSRAYEQKLEKVRAEAESELQGSQKIYEEIFEIELTTSQRYIDNFLDTIISELSDEKEAILKDLDKIVQSLCLDIEARLSI
jgi:F-type H+-transporting ATPase subunit b